MAELVGEYRIGKKFDQKVSHNYICMGDTLGFKLKDNIDVSEFSGAKLDVYNNCEYNFEGSDPANLCVRSLVTKDRFSVKQNDWRDIKLLDFCINENLLFLLIVRKQRSSRLSMYVLTLDGVLVTKSEVEFGTYKSAQNLDSVHLVQESHTINIFIETYSETAAAEMRRVKVTTGRNLINANELVWYECKCYPDIFTGRKSAGKAYGIPKMATDELYYQLQESNRPRLLQIYNFETQLSREIVLRSVMRLGHTEDVDAQLISSAFCIDTRRGKILVPYTRLRGFFNHHLILRIFGMNGLVERELIIWDCEENCELGLPSIPMLSYANWSWPIEPIEIVVTDDGQVLVTWISGSLRSGMICTTLTKIY